MNHKFLSILPMLASTTIIAILLTYSNAEYSWNSTALIGEADGLYQIRNIIADILFQTFGSSIYLLPIATLIWSFKIFLGSAPTKIYIRIMLMVFVLLCMPASLYLTHPYTSGVVGMYLNYSLPIINKIHIALFVISAVAYIISLSVSLYQFTKFFYSIYLVIKEFCNHIIQIFNRLFNKKAHNKPFSEEIAININPDSNYYFGSSDNSNQSVQEKKSISERLAEFKKQNTKTTYENAHEEDDQPSYSYNIEENNHNQYSPSEKDTTYLNNTYNNNHHDLPQQSQNHNTSTYNTQNSYTKHENNVSKEETKKIPESILKNSFLFKHLYKGAPLQDTKNINKLNPMDINQNETTNIKNTYNTSTTEQIVEPVIPKTNTEDFFDLPKENQITGTNFKDVIHRKYHINEFHPEEDTNLNQNTMPTPQSNSHVNVNTNPNPSPYKVDIQQHEQSNPSLDQSPQFKQEQNIAKNISPSIKEYQKPDPINYTNLQNVNPVEKTNNQPSMTEPQHQFKDSLYANPTQIQQVGMNKEEPNIENNSYPIYTINEEKSAADIKIEESIKNYHIPTSFLQNKKHDASNVSKEEIQANARKLEKTMSEFSVEGKVVNIKTGPVVTLYEITIPAGVKTSKLISLETDIALRMKAISVRIAVVPGKDVIGIEIPNKTRKTVYFKEILETQDFQKADMKLPLILGHSTNGSSVVSDLATMPHLLIAGTTGSGKSVGINTMILSLLYKYGPDACKFIMIDPKMLELSIYQDIAHLLTPVVTNPKQAITALKWAVKEMEFRYYKMSLLGVRNVIGYNEKIQNHAEIEAKQRHIKHEKGLNIDFCYMPYIVVIIDEMADLMMVAGKEVEAAVQRLAQMARAAGIHVIMATQRPSADVITGTIKANFPTRIAFQVSSKIDSRIVLESQGAEQLLGKGDMLFMPGVGRLQRVHAPFISDEEVSSIVGYLKKSVGKPHYINEITEDPEKAEETTSKNASDLDELYNQAIEIIISEKKVSTSFLQRKFQIGYNRAARIVEQLEENGIISKASPTGKRDILIQH